MTVRTNSTGWHSSVDKGKRLENEDTFCHGVIQLESRSGAFDGQQTGSSDCTGSSTNNATELLVAGCFDGHGGDTVSKHLAQHMTQRISSQLQGKDVNSNAAVAQALAAAFGSIDRELRLAKTARLTGSTAVVALVTNSMIHISSCGDSRAIICQGFEAIQPVQDHTPLREDERARIQRLGGQIFQRNGMRVMGALAMSRAIGDHALRPYGVTADPDVAHHERCDSDDYLILASDGLWNVLSNKDVACIIQLLISELSAIGLSRAQISALLPKILTRIALQRGSTDNITILTLDISQNSNSRPLMHQKDSGMDIVAATDVIQPGTCAYTDTDISIQQACPRLLNQKTSCGDASSISKLALQRIKHIIQLVSSSKWDSRATAAAMAAGSWCLQAVPDRTAATAAVQLMPSVGARQIGQPCSLSVAASGAIATTQPSHSTCSIRDHVQQQHAVRLSSSVGIHQSQQERHDAIRPAAAYNCSLLSRLHDECALQQQSRCATHPSALGSPMVSPFEVAQQFQSPHDAAQQWSVEYTQAADYSPFSLITNIPNGRGFGSDQISALEACRPIPASARKRRLVTTGSGEDIQQPSVQQSCPAPTVCGLQPPNKLQRLGVVSVGSAATVDPLQPHASWLGQDSTWIAMSASA
eukprot:GHUV01000798.1.p1 GENE.GHUV01000798.1~~GHUV01000798.1.p1  ORF type:complete len:644 (+),score=188.14 GHUV01000798.1:1116-3047(+)